ncbi:MAG: serine/threonine-protein phosphatase [Rhodobacteraceae bacterium]|nr:serine/threonine-protein phosphatase [Paracoccaceae bacterium]
MRTVTAEFCPEFETGSATDVGCRRDVNEDALLARPDWGLWAVADGMGGHEAGDFASSAIVRQLDTIGHAASGEDLTSRLMDRLLQANRLIRARGEELGGSTVGSTVVTLLVHGCRYTCIWSGDSRAYLLRNGQLVQQSRDHTEANALLIAGTITPEEAENWPRKNVITRAVGTGSEPQCDQVCGRLEPGDVFCLCSDGLTEHLQDHEIAACLASMPPQQACDALIRETRNRGARDNVTVVAVRCTAAGGAGCWPAGDILDDLA